MSTVKQFQNQLIDSGYNITDRNAVLTAFLSLKDMGEKHVSAMLLDGPPGTGKTYLAEKLANVIDAEILFFQFYRGAGKEELLYDLDISRIIQGMSGSYVPKDFGEICSLGILPKAAHISQEKKCILVLDEFDKSHPSTDAFLLDFLQYGRLSIPHIGELKVNTSNLMVVLTKNDERELSEPLLRRCRIVRMSFPDSDTETYMLKKSVPEAPIKLCKTFVTIANKLRDCDNVISTPELIRLIKDVLILYEEKEYDNIGDIMLLTLVKDMDITDKKIDPRNWSGIIKSMLKEGQ